MLSSSSFTVELHTQIKNGKSLQPVSANIMFCSGQSCCFLDGMFKKIFNF